MSCYPMSCLCRAMFMPYNNYYDSSYKLHMPCRVMSHHAINLSCHPTSCYAIPCHVMPRHVILFLDKS